MAIDFQSVVLIIRIFGITKADKFYLEYLGFEVDWNHHRFDNHAPIYSRISRGNLTLHLSEHHGDGSPVVQIRIMMRGIEEYHCELGEARN